MRTLLIILVATLAVQSAGDATRPFVLTALQPVPGKSTLARAINSRGDVAGVSAVQEEGQRAVVWRRNVPVELPPLPGDVASLAEDINNRGQVVGASVAANGNYWPVMWDDGQVVPLGMLPGAVTGVAVDINDRGEIAGSIMLYDVWRGESRAVVWRDGVVSDLSPEFVGTSGAFSTAWGINNRGQVVGQRGAGGGAYLWDRGHVIDLGTLGGYGAVPMAINDREQITGSSQTSSGTTHAFLWENGVMTDLGTLPDATSSNGFRINNRGEVVGQSESRGFLWARGVMIDLGTLRTIPGDTSRAEGINERGDIVGQGFDASQRRAVLWTRNPS